jgi:hypothetical protein
MESAAMVKAWRATMSDSASARSPVRSAGHRRGRRQCEPDGDGQRKDDPAALHVAEVCASAGRVVKPPGCSLSLVQVAQVVTPDDTAQHR